MKQKIAVLFTSIAVFVLAGLLFLTKNTETQMFGANPRVLVPIQGGTGTSTIPDSGDILMSSVQGSYGPYALVAGSNVTINTSTFGQITISSTGGGGGGGGGSVIGPRPAAPGGTGGSGVVVIRFPDTQFGTV